MTAPYHATLYRHHECGAGTFGVLTSDEFACFTLELSWNDNRRNASCIPLGAYPVRWEHSPSFQRNTYRLGDVEGRSGVLIHPANTSDELRGCIAPGLRVTKNRVSGWGVRDSIKALEALQAHFRDDEGKQRPFVLEIIAATPVDVLGDEATALVALLDAKLRGGGRRCIEVYGGVGVIPQRSPDGFAGDAEVSNG